MISLVLLSLICLGLAVQAKVQQVHMRWVRQEFRRNDLAHGRIVERLPPRLPADRRQTQVWNLRKPAGAEEDWADDFQRTALREE